MGDLQGVGDKGPDVAGGFLLRNSEARGHGYLANKAPP